MISGSRYTRVACLFILVAFLVGFSFLHRQTAAAQQAWSLPSPWSAQDIGNPAIPSTGSFDQGTFTITAEGSDIWGQSDQFNFVYQQVTGDVEVIARVDSLLATNSWAKTGVMIRSSLAAGAAHGFSLVSPGNGVAFQWRLTDGASSGNTYGPSAAAPYWVKLVRKGSTVTAYSSSNGSTWSTIGSQTVALGAAAYVGIATTSHNTSSSTTATVSQVTVNPLSLPAPQQARDVGAPTIAGSTNYNQGVYTIHAGGADIWGTSDQFHFVYQPMTGDGEIVARVRSITNTNSWAKAGVMIRETLAAGSRHASAFVTPGSGYAFQRRIDPGGISQNTAGWARTPPGWVRLVRTGTQIDAYQSTDGSTWTLIGTDAVPMVDTVYVGIAATSHNTSVATDAVVDSFKVTQGASTTNQPPTVAITSPTGGSTFSAGSNVAVSAAANDSDGTVSRVDFFVGTTQIGSDTTAPYSATWSNVASGTYTVTAKAVDNDGASTTSAAVSVQVNTAANQPPTVSLTAPANGTSYTAPASISLAASASDADGTISKVEFYNGTTLLNSDTTAPYSYSWTNVAAGTYSLTARVYDSGGATATSSAVSITVSSGTGFPAPWTAADVGNPALSGSSSYSNGIFSVDVGGVDIWGTSDQFHFIYQPIVGDVEIIARVDSLTVVDSYTNAGVMIRGSLNSSSMHGYSTVTGSNPLAYRYRVTNGGTTTLTPIAWAATPMWVRLVRQGSTVTSYQSSNGTSWSMMGSQSLVLGSTAYVGLAVCSHSATTRTHAQFSNVRVITTSANQAPTVTLTSPTNASTFTAPASVTLSATAADTDGTIAKVEFYNGTTLLNTDTAAPYTYTWSSVPAGTYALKAVAYDNNGASASSLTSTITVGTSTTSTAPTGVAFTASPDHATLVTYYELRIYASGADPSTATPIATSNLGKPTPDATNTITVNQATFFSGLTVGNYVGAVAAVGSGGSSVSTGVTFTR